MDAYVKNVAAAKTEYFRNYKREYRIKGKKEPDRKKREYTKKKNCRGDKDGGGVKEKQMPDRKKRVYTKKKNCRGDKDGGGVGGNGGGADVCTGGDSCSSGDGVLASW